MPLTHAALVKTSLLDFPHRVAAVIFTPGCNFRCPWCHNRGLVIPPFDDGLICKDEIFDFLKKRKNVLSGVVVSGGEPLIHENLKEWLIEIKSLGFQVKLDTNGSFPDALDQVRPWVDFVAMDIKNSFENYDGSTGVKTPVGELERTVNLIKTHWPLDHQFRTTWVPGINSIQAVPSMVKSLGPGESLTLQKFRPGELVSWDSTMNQVMTPQDWAEVSEAFSNLGVMVRSGDV